MHRSTVRGFGRPARSRMLARFVAIVLTVITTPIAAATPVPLTDNEQPARPARVAKDTTTAVVPYQAPSVGGGGGIQVDPRPAMARYQPPDVPTEVVSGRGEHEKVIANP